MHNCISRCIFAYKLILTYSNVKDLVKGGYAMNFGKTVSNIRKNKHMSIDEVTNSTITKSSYSRFVEGKTQPSIANFITILNNLHVNFEEFLYIDRGFRPDFLSEMSEKIKKNALLQDLRNLEELNHTFAVYHQQDPQNTVYYHFQCITKLIINFLKGKPLDQKSAQTIHDYLMQCEIWTHYEHTLFNSVIFTFDVSTVQAMEKRIIKNLDNYQLMHEYGNESFRTMIVMLGFYIRKKDLMAAIRIVSKLSNFQLESFMIFEKNLYKLFSGIVFMLSNQENGIENIGVALEVFKLTNCKEYLCGSLTFLKRIAEIYDYHHPKLDEIFAAFS